ncbi:PaaI family thioesterase [Leucobacter exalbidus]|uniref:PaaI family thioesterase n=1 Tax=Leucobacter exalbidus TaxID=662960 RepID=UPI001AE61763
MSISIASVQSILAIDPATRNAGIMVEHASPDELVLALQVTSSHTNSAGICHGGIIFLLADSASGIAANIGTGDSVWVTTASQVHYLASARPGDRLWASCRLRWPAGSGIAHYETIVTDGNNVVSVVDATMKRVRGAAR